MTYYNKIVPSSNKLLCNNLFKELKSKRVQESKRVRVKEWAEVSKNRTTQSKFIKYKYNKEDTTTMHDVFSKNIVYLKNYFIW